MDNKKIVMSSKELHKGAIIKDCLNGKYTSKEAGTLLKLTARHIRRLKKIVKEFGLAGLVHKLRGKESKKKIPKDIEENIVKIINDKYWDFTPGYVCEKLREVHNIICSDECTRQLMIRNNIWFPKKRKDNSEYRQWRDRKEHRGEMIQYDGSYHDWFEGRLYTEKLPCLLGGVDDAKGEIMYLKFDTDEGVIPTMKFWTEYVLLHGKPHEIYLDKHTTYKKSGLNPYRIWTKEEELTQFQRACSDFGVKVTNAHSPQAKGRIERLFGTLQNRLVREMRLNNICSIEEANKFLTEKFIPWYNNKYAKKPKKKADFHKVLTKRQINELPKIFCIKEKRVLANDFTVQHDNTWYQVLKDQPCLVCRKDKITVEKHLNGEIKLALRNKYLNFKALTEKPQPLKRVTVYEIKKKMKTYIPPKNHPWRKPFFISKNSKPLSELIRKN